MLLGSEVHVSSEQLYYSAQRYYAHTIGGAKRLLWMDTPSLPSSPSAGYDIYTNTYVVRASAAAKRTESAPPGQVRERQAL